MLMLKNEVKDLFKSAKLNDFTVGRDSVGHLNIVGPCGKPLVAITNFSIGSKLTKAEREICVDDHIKPVLAAHTKTILELIKAKEEQVKTSEAYDVAKKSAQADGYSVSFGVHNRYGADANLPETYTGEVSFRKKNDTQNIWAKVNYNSTKSEYEIQSSCEDIIDVPVAAKITKDCKKVNDTIDAIFMKHVKAVGDVRIAEEKLRVECAI